MKLCKLYIWIILPYKCERWKMKQIYIWPNNHRLNKPYSSTILNSDLSASFSDVLLHSGCAYVWMFMARFSFQGRFSLNTNPYFPILFHILFYFIFPHYMWSLLYATILFKTCSNTTVHFHLFFQHVHSGWLFSFSITIFLLPNQSHSFLFLWLIMLHTFMFLHYMVHL